MTPEQFAYWLQGVAETVEERPTDRQWQVIKDHLDLLFDKVTPERKAEGDGISGAGRDFEPVDVAEVIRRVHRRHEEGRPARRRDLLLC